MVVLLVEKVEDLRRQEEEISGFLDIVRKEGD